MAKSQFVHNKRENILFEIVAEGIYCRFAIKAIYQPIFTKNKVRYSEVDLGKRVLRWL